MYDLQKWFYLYKKKNPKNKYRYTILLAWGLEIWKNSNSCM